ncbi:hypothetical protein [Neobacillus notoginsengisoli]|uniref:hypothetical protein n=1 Tax=Neobacillus notoginsengisoli TaxID=1578198 RepID=UPI00115C5451|nr:hypothetical protein [Neobacillus notoginsengisoli]
MKQNIRRVLINFFSIFILIIIFGLVFKPNDINSSGIIRALVISFASALAWVTGQNIFNRKISK